ncbi:YlmC/YmxH family sporulation protein [Paenibacillus alkalitolerans]|uniref:YlmC/YmxH family sporulation protein n=1 Tax=Paenibacillus alkalitolerans TaxID=2799335 RepID=UPI0018F27F3A|nr:YlmC/YmxH family sporulation protein [Paenibacillus alkalitolerans]
MKISDFQTKDVINIVDGRKLGQISDLELDLRGGRIDSIVVPSPARFFGFFGGGADLVIPWRSIVKIGADVVLVRMDDPRAYRPGEDDAEPKSYRERERDRDRDRDRYDRERERDRDRDVYR